MSGEAPFDRVVARLRESVTGLRVVYRFGSHATEAERADSDLDLAVLTDPPLDPDARMHLRWTVAERVAALVRRDVDLVDLGSASTVFRAHVVTSGERLWCADVAEAERFEMYALSAYARLNEERAGILRDIHARGRIRG